MSQTSEWCGESASPLNVLFAAECSLIPVGRNKKPCLRTWKAYQEKRADWPQILDWQNKFKPAGWAIVYGFISRRICLDFDGPAGASTLQRLGIAPHRQTGSGGFHADYEHPGWRVPTLNAKTKRSLGQQWPGLDIRGDGGYAVVIGRSKKGEYTWLRDQVPYSLSILSEDLRDFLGLLHAPNVTTSAERKPLASATTLSSPERHPVDPERLIQRALGEAAAFGRNNAGFWLAVQLRDNVYTELEAQSVMRSYTLRVPSTNAKGERESYTVSEAFASLKQAYSSSPREPWRTSARNMSNGIRPSAVARARIGTLPEAPEHKANPPDLLNGFDPEDVGNGARIQAMYGDDLRYCYEMNKWLAWDRKRWALDEMPQVCPFEQSHPHSMMRANSRNAESDSTRAQSATCSTTRSIAAGTNTSSGTRVKSTA